MSEAVEAQQIMLAAMAGALVVLFGAVHALCLAWAKLKQSRPLMWWSWAAYACFAITTLVLGKTLQFSGFWNLVLIVMLLGYLLAPHGIWHLSVATHGGDHEAAESEIPSSNSGEPDHE